MSGNWMGSGVPRTRIGTLWDADTAGRSLTHYDTVQVPHGLFYRPPSNAPYQSRIQWRDLRTSAFPGGPALRVSGAGVSQPTTSQEGPGYSWPCLLSFPGPLQVIWKWQWLDASWCLWSAPQEGTCQTISLFIPSSWSLERGSVSVQLGMSVKSATWYFRRK